MDRPSHRFLNRSAILTWFLRGAIVWVVSLPLALRAIQALEHLESAAPSAFVAPTPIEPSAPEFDAAAAIAGVETPAIGA